MPIEHNTMQVFHIATECAGIASVGGLGDVVFQIAKHGALAGIDTTVILPLYGALDAPFWNRHGSQVRQSLRTADTVYVRLWFPGKADPGPEDSEPVRFVELDLPLNGTSLRLCLVDTLRFNRRPVPYGRPAYPDVYPINLLLQKAALTYIAAKSADRGPVVIHGHDAHVATLALAARRSFLFADRLGHCNYLVTAHNLGWGLRQRLWMDDVQWETSFLAHALDVDRDAIGACIINDGDQGLPGFEPFAAAALYGDHLTIVSEGYGWEIAQAAVSETAESDREIGALADFWEAHRRAGTLRAEISGITNGIDPSEVGPEAIDAAVGPQGGFTVDFKWKPAFQSGFVERVNRTRPRPAYWDQIAAMVGSLDLFQPGQGALFTYVGRLDRQKGADILVRAVEEVFGYDKTPGLCLLGDGPSAALEKVAARFAGRVVILKGRSEAVAREIFAAGDFLLMPSRFEPCGLVDLRAQLNGNLPLANQVGGLSKIVNGRTGIGFFGLGDRSILRGLVDAMHRAIDLRTDNHAHGLMMDRANAWVRQTCTWEKVFPVYRQRYEAPPMPRT